MCQINLVENFHLRLLTFDHHCIHAGFGSAAEASKYEHDCWAHDWKSNIHGEAKKQLEALVANYGRAMDKPRKSKSFNEGDLMMAHLRKEWFLRGEYNKRALKKIGPFCILHMISVRISLIFLIPMQIPRPSISDIYTNIMDWNHYP